MNLFEKYGIKEVADVVFYSINQVGDNEVIYTPVLFLDTLKVSTYEKSAESVFATGGLKNKRLIKWNFGKNIKLSLEDALFSPSSMSLIWGGKLDSKLSDATSIVTKVNFANTYGKLQYSSKAYPSPSLTSSEWEIIFKIIGRALGIDTQPSNYSGTSWVLDNNYYSNLSQDYRRAFQKRYIERPYLFNGIEKNESQISTYSYDNKIFGNNFEESYLQIPMLQIEGYENTNEHYDSNGRLKVGHERWYQAKAMPEYIIYIIRKEISELSHLGKIETNINNSEVVDRMERCLVTKKGGLTISGKQQLDNLFRYYADDRSSSYTIFYDAKTMLPLVQIKDNKIVKSLAPYDIEKEHITVTQMNITQNTENGKQLIREFFNNLQNGEEFTREDILALDKDFVGGNMNTYLDYSFRRDACQMIPITDPHYGDPNYIFDYKIRWNGWTDGQPQEDWTIASGNFIYLEASTQKIGAETDFKIKYGTVYYKWTRTVKYKEYEDDSILGQSFVIDAETFPADYRIVGETYIRNQKTGKDQRYQITIFKANVSSDTSITLQADGEPTTFTMDIDVLTPENDIMMEMKQIDVEEDKFEGGTRIVPQPEKYSYTPTMADDGEILIPIDNNEIY